MERYYNEVTKTSVAGSYNNYSCNTKALIDALLEVDDIFELVKVNKNSQTEYDATIRVAGSAFCLRVNGYYDGLSVKACKEDGTVSDYYYTNCSSMIPGSAGYDCKVSISKIDDFMFTITFKTNYNSKFGYFTFMKGVSEYDNETYWFYYGGYTSVTFDSKYTPGLPSIVGNSFGAFKESTSEFVHWCGFGYSNVTSICTTPTKAVGVMNPVCYYVNQSNGGTSYWFGHIKWGGKYDIYMLYSNTGIYSVMPTVKYLVDGKNVTPVFSQLYDFTEC